MTKRKRITSTLGLAARALASVPEDTAAEASAEAREDLRAAKRGRELLSAMAGTIHTITVLEVQPGRCRMWAHHNRFYDLLNAENCSDLIESFKTQGQIHPAIVRKCVDDAEHDYELICGARRHWTASYLKRDLLVEVREVSDEEAFLLGDADNRDAKDISDYERAVEYGRALEAYYQGSQRPMAAKLGISDSLLSQFLALAELDHVLVSAYPDPRWIKVHHAVAIRPLWKQAALRARLSSRARELAELPAEEKPRDGATVFQALMATARGTVSRRQPVVQTFPAKDTGNKMLTVRWHVSGKIGVEIERNSGAPVDEIIETLKNVLSETAGRF
jgi:ParB family chromosome partitioning protein